jgi:hypothetical protein
MTSMSSVVDLGMGLHSSAVNARNLRAGVSGARPEDEVLDREDASFMVYVLWTGKRLGMPCEVTCKSIGVESPTFPAFSQKSNGPSNGVGVLATRTEECSTQPSEYIYSLFSHRSDTIGEAVIAIFRNSCQRARPTYRDIYTLKRFDDRNRVAATCPDSYSRCVDRRRLASRDGCDKWNGSLFGTHGV